VSGEFSVDIFRLALTEVFRRHEVLRSIFGLSNGEVYQRVEPPRPPAIPVIDLRHLPAPERYAEARQLSMEEAAAPFQLATGPLLRSRVLRLDDREYLVLLTTHHIVSDRWSTSILFNELSKLYTAYQHGFPSPLPEPLIQYADFACWQRDRIQGERLEQLIEYWRDELGDPEETLDLPTDHLRPLARTFRCASISFNCPVDLTSGLKQLSRHRSVTIFNTLLATFQLLLHRYTGQQSVRVGTPVSNRDRVELEQVIGPFINMLVIRARCCAALPFSDLLLQVHDTVLRGLSHKDAPFERLIAELLPERDITSTPLFQTMFVFEERQPGEAGGEFQLEPVAVEMPTSPFDLTLLVREGEDTFFCTLTYSSELFEPDTVNRMSRNWLTALEAIVHNPATPLSQIPMATGGELGRWREDGYLDFVCQGGQPTKAPAHGNGHGDETRMRSVPRLPVEQLLAGIWSEVSTRQSIGIHDNFFRIGGHSLLAVRVISRIRQVFGVDLPLRLLFERPTIASLAQELESALQSENAASAPIHPAARTGPLPLSFEQQRLWYLHQLNPESSVYHLAVNLRIAGRIDSNVLARALAEIGRRHESLRTTFVAIDGVPAQVISPEANLGFREVDLSWLGESKRDEELRRLIRQEAETPFDLGTGPLLRSVLFRVYAEDYRLLLTMHHIISDGWSTDVLVKEVAVIYEAFVEGRAHNLSPLFIQYVDYAVWQRGFLQGAYLEQQLAFWRKLLREEETLVLPFDRPRRAENVHRGATVSFVFPDPVATALRTIGRNEGATLFMTCLAAFQILLYRYSGQPTFRIGIPVAGRNRRELEPLIGLFVNMIVLRANCAGNPSFRALLQRVRSGCLDAYAHQDVPFDQVVAHLHPARDLAHNPLFQVVFSLQEPDEQPVATGSLKLTASPETVETNTAKFDLSLFLSDTGVAFAGELQYDEALFETATIRGMAARFQAVVAAIAANADER
ncbi:MAG TPA: condensation domain-containing protein, partial [Candidatus Acidoferrales bacterium]|nr:condensation domain-containing protein [Candidatus Acidoferrales bacterium]